MIKPPVSENTSDPTPANDRQSRGTLRERRLRYFKRADSWFNSFVRMLSGVHEGFWLGVLSISELNALTAQHYDSSQESASPEHNMRGLFDWELAAVDRYFQPGTRVLVAAAGGGREVLALRRGGYDVEGFECNSSLVEAGNAMLGGLGEPRGISLSAPDEVPAGLPVYGGVIVGWSAYSHIPTRARRVEFLRALRQHTLPGSPVLLSFFTRAKDSSYETAVYRTATLIKSVVPGRTESSEVGDHLSWGYSHWFTREEIEGELRQAGIRLAHFSELGDGHAVGIVE